MNVEGLKDGGKSMQGRAEIIAMIDAMVDEIVSDFQIGEIYESFDATNPATLFGGEWEQIKDCFLRCAKSGEVGGATGGADEHTLTENEVPKHTHKTQILLRNMHNDKRYISYDYALHEDAGSLATTSGEDEGVTQTQKYSVVMDEVGGNVPHSNVPYYKTRYAWRKVR